MDKIEIDIPLIQSLYSGFDGAIADAHLYTADANAFLDTQQIYISYWYRPNGGRWELKQHKMKWDMVKLLYGKEVPLWK